MFFYSIRYIYDHLDLNNIKSNVHVIVFILGKL